MQQGAGATTQGQTHVAAVAPAALQAPPGQPGGVAAPWMTGAASPGIASVQTGNANIRPMSMSTAAAKTNDKRGGGIVRAIATQADPDGWQE